MAIPISDVGPPSWEVSNVGLPPWEESAEAVGVGGSLDEVINVTRDTHVNAFLHTCQLLP